MNHLLPALGVAAFALVYALLCQLFVFSGNKTVRTVSKVFVLGFGFYALVNAGTWAGFLVAGIVFAMPLWGKGLLASVFGSSEPEPVPAPAVCPKPPVRPGGCK